MYVARALRPRKGISLMNRRDSEKLRPNQFGDREGHE